MKKRESTIADARTAREAPELLSAISEICPDSDPHEVLSEFRKLAVEHYRRVRLLFH